MKRLLALLRLEKAAIHHYHFLYLGFFLVYFILLYGILYHLNNLSPFQHNFPFFANVVGSLSKRFLSEISPFLLIFFLLFHSAKRLWMRLWLVGLFDAIFLTNTLTLFYYFVTRANYQFYALKGFEWHLFFTFFTPVLTVALLGFMAAMVSLSAALIKIRAKEPISPAKKWSVIALLALLAFGAPFIPIRYSANESVRGSDKLENAFYQTVELENSGLAVLVREAGFVLYPPKKTTHLLTSGEKELIASEKLDERIQTPLKKPYNKIVLIVAESLSQQFLSNYNPKLPGMTPALDQLMDDYPHLDAFYPSGYFTLQGVTASLCGHSNLDQSLQRKSHVCVPKILKDAGYKTEFIRGATKYYVEEDVSFKKMGYDTLFAKEEMAKKYPEFIVTQPKLYKTWGYTDNYVFDEAIDRLKKAKPNEKMMLTLLTLDMHVPGGRCSRAKTAEDPEDPILFSVHCLDQEIGTFMDRLIQQKLLTDDTAILLIADHPYPAYFEIPGADFQPSFLMEPNRIPLALITKAKLPLMARQGSQVDIGPTLLNLANQPTPPYYMGKSLLSNLNPTPMGQDRKNGYMIVDGRFHPLSLNTSPQELSHETALKEEYQDADPDSAFHKWYYNQYFNLE
jgi:phosphoglycerol transferase MdoB-like AlkP superfamily enzyme